MNEFLRGGLNALLGGIMGFILAKSGIFFNDWRYWAMFIIIFAFCLVNHE